MKACTAISSHLRVRSLWIPTAATLLVLAILLGAVFQAYDRERTELGPEERAGLPGQFIDLPEGAVHYELSGPVTGPLVVLVNGFSASYFLWDRNVDALTAAGFRVLRYDLYGRGFSDRPGGAYDLSRFTRQLDALLDVLRVEGAVDLVGISLGGQIAAAYTGAHPERVRRLVLLSPQMAQIDARTIFPVNLWGVGEYLFDVYIEPYVLAVPEGNFFRPEDFPEWEGEIRRPDGVQGVPPRVDRHPARPARRSPGGVPTGWPPAARGAGAVGGGGCHRAVEAMRKSCWRPSPRRSSTPSPRPGTSPITSGRRWSIRYW